jgi:hypothetical protein
MLPQHALTVRSLRDLHRGLRDRRRATGDASHPGPDRAPDTNRATSTLHVPLNAGPDPSEVCTCSQTL